MEFHRRKLMSVSDKSSEECSSFCDSDINKSAFCPPSCFSDCPKVCRFSLTLPSKPLKISPYLILSLSLLATAIFLVFLYVIYIKCYSRRRRLSRRINSEAAEAGRDDFIDEDQEPVVDHPIWYIRTVGLQPAVISAITICKYKKGDGLVEGTECSVCLNEFQEDETLRLLPKCNHAFHIPCIDTWLSSHTNCPMCRAGIVSTATGAPSPEQSLENSGPLEEAQEAQVEVPDNSDRIEEMEEIVCERELEVRVDDNDIQPMRRSVSMDSLSASVLTLALADLRPEKTNKNNNNGDSNSESQSSNSGKSSNMPIIPKRVCGNQSLLKLMESSSMGRILQSGSSSMKRSFSCSGKLFLMRHNRRRSWVPPS